jgi:uncharacterized LabA/DUF88 family protein
MASASKKVVAFVDGSNLFGGIAEILKPGEYFEFDEFVAALEKEIDIDQINFYGTYMRADQKTTEKATLLALAQKEFFDSAKNHKKLSFYSGHFSKTSGKEKGVDMHMGIDMAIGACLSTFNQAIVVTGDADLLYAVQVVRRFGKQATVACLGSRFPLALVLQANKTIVIDLNKHFAVKIQPKLRIKPKKLEKVMTFCPAIKKVRFTSVLKDPPASGGHVRK